MDPRERDELLGLAEDPEGDEAVLQERADELVELGRLVVVDGERVVTRCRRRPSSSG
jgi:hypothetical protein